MEGFVDNENYMNGIQGVPKQEEPDGGREEAVDKEAAKPRELFALWRVKEQAYKLKLTPSAIIALERVYKCNLISLMGDMDHLPTLTTMLQITHSAMEKWHHNLKLKDVEQLYDTWIGEGRSMLQFYVEVYMKIFSVSGFFSSAMVAELTETMEDVSKIM